MNTPTAQDKPSKHILRTSVGVTIELVFDKADAHFSCAWSPAPPYRAEVRDQVVREYLPWRDSIIEAWSKRTGKRALVVTI
jgi:hypothetical protein